MLHIILGTHNAKKLRELRMLIPQDSLQLSSLADLEQQSINVLEVEETGETFQENARLKAVQQAQHLGQWVLGEDSGLSVTALDGRHFPETSLRFLPPPIR
ncbi:MAG: non-canonical purine NTP pyrophosphatase [Planctomycetota bacterium]